MLLLCDLVIIIFVVVGIVVFNLLKNIFVSNIKVKLRLICVLLNFIVFIFL